MASFKDPNSLQALATLPSKINRFNHLKTKKLWLTQAEINVANGCDLFEKYDFIACNKERTFLEKGKPIIKYAYRKKCPNELTPPE